MAKSLCIVPKVCSLITLVIYCTHHYPYIMLKALNAIKSLLRLLSFQITLKIEIKDFIKFFAQFFIYFLIIDKEGTFYIFIYFVITDK